CRQIGADGLKLGHTRQRPHIEGLRNRRRDQPALGELRQIDPPDAVTEAAAGLGSEPQAKARLAAPPGTGQRQQPRRSQGLAKLAELALAANEARERQRHVDAVCGRLPDFGARHRPPPRSWARAASAPSSARLCTSSLSKTWARWFLTVAREMNIR